MDKFPNRNIFVLNTMKNINDNERLKSNKKLMKKKFEKSLENKKKSPLIISDLRPLLSIVCNLPALAIIDCLIDDYQH